DQPHALVAARLSAEFAIGVRHGCFCAHPYLTRLLGLSAEAVGRYRDDVRSGDRRAMPGAVRASASLASTSEDVDRLAAALARLTDGSPPPLEYVQDPHTGDFHLPGWTAAWSASDRGVGSGCARG
ncbi:MAG TPA: hypothetical protein VG455_16310, partial [Acidimicrobiales bacterium]|nr:hypothetical protein [Acidimicrobiales bacterium]